MGLLDSIGDLLGSKPNMPKYNAGQLNGVVQKGKDEQTNFIGDTMPKLGQATNDFESNATGAVDASNKARQDTNNAFLNSLSEKRNMATNAQFQTGKQQILQGINPAQDAIRENLSGSGVGLQGGAAIKALSAPVQQAGGQISDLAHSLANNAQTADITATSHVNDINNNAIAQNLGITQDIYNTVMSSDRQDLKDQLNEMLGISSQATSDQLGIAQNQFTADLANASAENQSRNALLSSLLGAGGTIAGGMMARRPMVTAQ